MIDLRHRVLRFAELRRKAAAHMPLAPAEQEELEQGIPAEEYLDIIEQIRHERRSAAPSKAALRAKVEGKARRQQQKAAVADLSTFLTNEHEGTSR